MNWVTIKRIFRTGFLNFWRNGFVSFASVMMMVFTLFIIGLAIFSGVILGTTLQQFRDKADMNVYFTTDAQESDILALQTQVNALPEVASTQYISAQDALANFRELHQNDQLTMQALQELEDFDVTNQYTALGPVKPGLFRRWLVSLLLVAIDYACRHVFTRGHLARVQTIHFARWAFLDNKTRVVFTSNYDGSHQSYMDDFINKVAWGLNLVFSNGVGWPRTRWLIFGGARHEQPFKYYQRRHQIPTQVWYKAYPGLTLADLRRNQRIREGLERSRMNEAQALAWLALL